MGNPLEKSGERVTPRTYLEKAVKVFEGSANTTAAEQLLREGIQLEGATPQEATELRIELARVLERNARGVKTTQEKNRILEEVRALTREGIGIARESGDETLLPIPLDFLGNVEKEAGNYTEALEAYTQAQSYPLPENHSPVFRLYVRGKAETVRSYLSHTKTDTPLQTAESIAQQIRTAPDTPSPDDATREIWATGVELRVIEALSQTHQIDQIDHARTLLQSVREICEQHALTHRLKDVEVAERKLFDLEFHKAQTLRNAGEITEAMESYRVLREKTLSSYPLLAADILHMMGITEYAQKERDLDHIDSLYSQSQAEVTTLGDTLRQGAILRDRASARGAKAKMLKETGNTQEAKKTLDEAVSLAQESIDILTDVDNPEHLGMSLVILARLQAAAGDLPTALITAHKGVEMADLVNPPTYFNAHARLDLARVLEEAGNKGEALLIITEAERMLPSIEEKDKTEYAEDRRKLQELRRKITGELTSPTES